MWKRPSSSLCRGPTRALKIVLVPGLLAEPDALKDQGKNQEIRQKVRSAGPAIKDLRSSGSLVEGVDLKHYA